MFFIEKSNIHIYLKKEIKYVGNLLFHTIHCKPSSNLLVPDNSLGHSRRFWCHYFFLLMAEYLVVRWLISSKYKKQKGLFLLRPQNWTQEHLNNFAVAHSFCMISRKVTPQLYSIFVQHEREINQFFLPPFYVVLEFC